MAVTISDKEYLKQAISGVLGSIASSLAATPTQTAAYQVVQSLLTDVWAVPVTDGGTAGTAVTEMPIVSVRDARRLKAVKFTAPVAITASDTLFATVTVAKRTAGGGSATMATFTTKITGGSGNLLAQQPLVIPLSASIPDLAAGDTLTVAVAKASTGTAIGSATAQASVQVELEAV